MYNWAHNSEEGAHSIFPPPSIMLQKWIAQKSVIHRGDRKAQVLLRYLANSQCDARCVLQKRCVWPTDWKTVSTAA